MDSISSASQTLLLGLTGASSTKAAAAKAAASVKPSASSADSHVTLTVTGIAHTVPYLIRVGLVCSSAPAHQSATDLVEDVAARVFREAGSIFSPYDPSSELMAVVNGRQTQDRIEVSEAMYSVLCICDDVVSWSVGAFDPTIVLVSRGVIQRAKDMAIMTLRKREQGDAAKNNPQQASGGTSGGGGASPSSSELDDLEAQMRSASWFPPEDDTDEHSRCVREAIVDSLKELERDAQVAEACDACGWREHVELSPRDAPPPRWMRKRRRSDVTMDVSSVSKGWTIDRLFTELQSELDVFDLYVDWGGDIRAVGFNPRPEPEASQTLRSSTLQSDAVATLRPQKHQRHSDPPLALRRWSSGILTPLLRRPSAAAVVVALPPEGGCLCTSGDYYQWRHLVSRDRGQTNNSGSATATHRPFRLASCEATRPNRRQLASLSLLLANASCALCDALTTAAYLVLAEESLNPCTTSATTSSPALSLAMVDRLASVVPRSAVRRVDVFWRHPDGSRCDEERWEAPSPHLDVSLATGVPLSSDGGNESMGMRWWFEQRLPSLDPVALCSISRSIPRSVAVVLFPSSTAAAEWIGFAVSSIVQVARRSFVFFLERNTAAHAAFCGRAAADSVMGVAVRIAVPRYRAAAATGTNGDPPLIQHFRDGARWTAGGASASQQHAPPLPHELLNEVLWVGDFSATEVPQGEHRRASGDHVAVLARWVRTIVPNDGDDAAGNSAGYHVQAKALAGGGMCSVMRLGKQWVSVPVPRHLLAAPRGGGTTTAGLTMPRCCVVAIVSHCDAATGRSTCSLATVLRGIDVASRSPPILSCVAPSGPLNRLLFSPFDVAVSGGIGGTVEEAAASSKPALCCARLHFFSHRSSEGDALVDWFKDVQCTDPAMQFLYHAPPPKQLVAEQAAGPGRESRQRWTVPYAFAGSMATIDVHLIAALNLSDSDDVPSKTPDNQQKPSGPYFLFWSPHQAAVTSPEMDVPGAFMQVAFQ